MRKLSPATILSALLALSWVGFIGSAPRAAQPEARSQQKWEYREVGSDVNSWGREGWEAYAVMMKVPNSDVSYFVKRPLLK